MRERSFQITDVIKGLPEHINRVQDKALSKVLAHPKVNIFINNVYTSFTGLPHPFPMMIEIKDDNTVEIPVT